MKATLIKNLTGFTGEAALYELDEPVDDGDGRHTKHVIVSATTAMDTGSPETYIFPATKDGGIVNYGELNGSYRGGLDMQRALDGLCNET